jgi:hypothetical protein
MEIILAIDLSFGFSLFAKSKLVLMSGCLPAISMDISPQSLIVISLTHEFHQLPGVLSYVENKKAPSHCSAGPISGFTSTSRLSTEVSLK